METLTESWRPDVLHSNQYCFGRLRPPCRKSWSLTATSSVGSYLSGPSRMFQRSCNATRPYLPITA